ncbi:methylmalonyl-CoA epimerase, mitochondrial isoform 1-T1 [Glossophaga mutica]
MARVLKVATVVAAASYVGGLFPRLQAAAPEIRALSTLPSPPRVARAVWSLGRLNHVAIAVPDLEKARGFYRDVLGAQVSETVPLPDHGVSVVFVNLGNTKMELLHPLGDDSPIAGFLQKNKAGGMHHVCIEAGGECPPRGAVRGPREKENERASAREAGPASSPPSQQRCPASAPRTPVVPPEARVQGSRGNHRRLFLERKETP